jgi:excisionase family DNA binding protein
MDYRDPEWAAERLGVDKNTLYKFLQDGTIPAIQLGRKWLISEARLAQWLAAETERQTQSRRHSTRSIDRAVRRMSHLTPESRLLLRNAYSEARRYGHRHLGHEHLLLAMAQGGLGKVLEKFDISPQTLREQLEADPDRNAGLRSKTRKPRMRRVVRLAMNEAAATGRKLVEPQDLLLGVAAQGGSSNLTVETVRNLLNASHKRNNHEHKDC